MHSTIHQLITLPRNKEKLLGSMCDLQNKMGHAVFARICKNNKNSKILIKSLSSKEVSEFQKKYDVLGRHVNSVNIAMGGKISSYVECQKLNLKNLQNELGSVRKVIKLATIQNGKNDNENAQIDGVLTSSPVNPTIQKSKKQNAFKGKRKNRDDYVNDAPKIDDNQALADISNPMMSKKDLKNIVHADINASFNMMRKIFSQAQYNPRKYRFNYHVVALQAQKTHVKYLC